MNNSDYWKANLIKWENRRYSELAALNPFSIPLRKRMESCRRLLEELALSLGSKEIKIIEFGCGSGLLAKQIKVIGITCIYQGYDLSQEGILKAKARNLGSGFSFDVLDLTQPSLHFDSDISIFLGLSDWLSLEENKTLFGSIHSKYYIWSYTLKTKGELENTSYSVFRRLRNKKGMKSLSWTQDEVNQLFQKCDLQRQRPDQKFSFGPGYISCLTPKEKY